MWNELAKRYKDEGIVLALGAGVSAGCKLPDWPTLLERIAEDACQPMSVAGMRRLGLSLPAIATLLQGEDDPVTFAGRVRAALYRDFPFLGGWKERRGEFVEYVDRSNATLSSVASFCAADPRIGQTGNPRVHAIVTFNIDAVFQEYVSARYGRKFVRTIERSTASKPLDKIGLYHVHGHLRFDDKWHDRTSSAPDALVLGEREYFDVFANPTGIFTYTFLHLLRMHTFLCVGLSISDDNLRRLLHYSRRELCAGYRAEGVEPRREKLDRHFAILKRPGTPEAELLLAGSLQALGVNPLWIDDFNEIPTRLRKLYESAGGVWTVS